MENPRLQQKTVRINKCEKQVSFLKTSRRPYIYKFDGSYNNFTFRKKMASYACCALSAYLTISSSLVCPVFIISLVTSSFSLGSFTFYFMTVRHTRVSRIPLGAPFVLSWVHAPQSGFRLRTVSPLLTVTLDTQSQSSPCYRNTLDNSAPPRWPLPSKPRSTIM